MLVVLSVVFHIFWKPIHMAAPRNAMINTRGLFLLTPLGRQILALDDEQASNQLQELDRQVRRQRPAKERTSTETPPESDDEFPDLNTAILSRLHRLTPEAFEEFCLYLLREFGMELRRVGGTGDEGIDGIGTAPISPVLSVTVAVQAKRWNPNNSTVSRDVVALFQRDAAAAGAERAVLITLGTFSEPARKASRQATPTVDLIDGERVCELVREHRIGLTESVSDDWFDRFESTPRLITEQ